MVKGESDAPVTSDAVEELGGNRMPRNRGILAKDLLVQISGDFDPSHFTLAEVKAEYAAVSTTESISTQVYYEKCFQLLDKAGLIANNKDGSYRICELFYRWFSECASGSESN